MTTFQDLKKDPSSAPTLVRWAASVETRLAARATALALLAARVEALESPATTWPVAPLGDLAPASPMFLHPQQGLTIVERADVVGGAVPTTGIGVMAWPPRADPTLRISDCRVADIPCSPMGSAKAGTDGAGIWAGQGGRVERCEVHDARWEGVWIGALARDLVVTDVLVDNRAVTGTDPGIGIYVEHAAERVEVTRCVVYPKKGSAAMNFEWRYADATYAAFDVIGDGRAGTRQVHVHDCLFYGHVVVDAGSYGHRFERVVFVGGDGVRPAVSLPSNIPAGTVQSTVIACDFTRWAGPAVAYHSRPIG